MESLICFIDFEAVEESVCQSKRLFDINLKIPISWDGHDLKQIHPSTKWQHFVFKDSSFITQIKVWHPFGLAGRGVNFSSVPLTKPIPWWGFILSWQTSDCKGSSCFCISAKFKMRFCLHLYRKVRAGEDSLMAQAPVRNMRGEKQESFTGASGKCFILFW